MATTMTETINAACHRAIVVFWAAYALNIRKDLMIEARVWLPAVLAEYAILKARGHVEFSLTARSVLFAKCIIRQLLEELKGPGFFIYDVSIDKLAKNVGDLLVINALQTQLSAVLPTIGGNNIGGATTPAPVLPVPPPPTVPIPPPPPPPPPSPPPPPVPVAPLPPQSPTTDGHGPSSGHPDRTDVTHALPALLDIGRDNAAAPETTTTVEVKINSDGQTNVASDALRSILGGPALRNDKTVDKAPVERKKNKKLVAKIFTFGKAVMGFGPFNEGGRGGAPG